MVSQTVLDKARKIEKGPPKTVQHPRELEREVDEEAHGFSEDKETPQPKAATHLLSTKKARPTSLAFTMAIPIEFSAVLRRAALEAEESGELVISTREDPRFAYLRHLLMKEIDALTQTHGKKSA